MATVADILKFIETIAPRSTKESWDHVGLNCGRSDTEVTKVLVALDPFDEACLEAKDFGAQLLVTHHVLIHEPGFITDATPQGRRVLFLIENGIAHINAHTNLDCAPGGVNDVLAARLSLQNIEVMNPSGTDSEGRPWGLIRMGTVGPQSMEAFMKTVTSGLGCPGLRYVASGKEVRKVAVGGGSCGGALAEVAAAGCDTFVTADIKYNLFRDAYDLGINLIDAGHFYTENPVCGYLAEQLQRAFPDLTVKVSETHRDCMKFY